ncbi:type II toxin-antitoxin system HicA family toxin [Gluconacetobacter takamatsuzukensis]|uniref:Type II toxin-antitoxin system HicA family toxin n=1 Tax=Gluconacetobacter takamatsuzukensis TaxID=1286190 RepID=A0A7W4KEK6_9PROT|nr:type II toxin-antitoxin system HicA family toxin [Gluconacetobacter takamatsuzukensis]MBB2205472.1 type II toxin-antitoxin system HicA family toxin [Gluconacetobacter takamatsuzukensis]
MNRKQRAVLAAIFARPAGATLAWMEIEALLTALGCVAIEGSGSRVKFVRNGRILAIHRPHPRKEARQYQVRAVRDYLEGMGITP